MMDKKIMKWLGFGTLIAAGITTATVSASAETISSGEKPRRHASQGVTSK